MSTTSAGMTQYIGGTLIAAATASLAASVSVAFALPLWAMFVGWIGFYTRGLDAKGAIENLGCIGLGLMFGMATALTLAALVPLLGKTLALPVVVFLTAVVVVSLRGLPRMNNLLCYFLGLVTWFAAHKEPSISNGLTLFFASAIGVGAGYLSVRASSWMVRR